MQIWNNLNTTKCAFVCVCVYVCVCSRARFIDIVESWCAIIYGAKKPFLVKIKSKETNKERKLFDFISESKLKKFPVIYM